MHKSNTFLFYNTFKNTIQSATFPWGMLTPSNTPIPRPTPLTTQTTFCSIRAISHNYATKSRLVTMRYPIHIRPENCPFAFDDLHPHLTQPVWKPAASCIQIYSCWTRRLCNRLYRVNGGLSSQVESSSRLMQYDKRTLLQWMDKKMKRKR